MFLHAFLPQGAEYIWRVAPSPAFPRSHGIAPLHPASVKAVGGTKWGYIDAGGAWRIRPQFEHASDFSDGRAAVQLNGRSGLIDFSGRFVVPPIYEWINDFSEGRATVIDRHGFGVIDENGRRLTGRSYDYIADYSDGRALFSQISGDTSLYGYLDRQGREVIPAQFLEGYNFRNGKTVVKIKDNEYALIGLHGERLATYPYAYVGAPGDGLLAFRREPDGKFGYIDEQGDVAIEPRFTGAMPFQEGRAVVNTAEDYRNAYGLIDRSGRFLIEPKYNDIRLLGEQRAAVGEAIDPSKPYIGSRYAISDLNGRLLTEFRFYEVNEYDHELAPVSDRTRTYFIDRSGKPAANLPVVEGSGTLSIEGPLIKADVDQRLSYYDHAGRLIWKQNTIIPLTSRYSVKEIKYKPNRDYLVYYPQVEGMGDTSAQERVNRRLRELSQVKDVPQGQLDYSYTGDFNVPFFRKELLQLELLGYNFPYGAAHGMPSQIYVHVNLTNGRIYELKDLFLPGSNYAAVLSGIVGDQIKNDPQYDYVFPDSYQGIKPDQPFFVTEDALHLYFQPYEIAPYAAGFPTFTIPFRQIGGILDPNGEFWRSFH